MYSSRTGRSEKAAQCVICTQLRIGTSSANSAGARVFLDAGCFGGQVLVGAGDKAALARCGVLLESLKQHDPIIRLKLRRFGGELWVEHTLDGCKTVGREDVGIGMVEHKTDEVAVERTLLVGYVCWLPQLPAGQHHTHVWLGLEIAWPKLVHHAACKPRCVQGGKHARASWFAGELARRVALHNQEAIDWWLHGIEEFMHDLARAVKRHVGEHFVRFCRQG